jgi:hypothetical protein
MERSMSVTSGDGDDLPHRPFVAVAVPGPYGRRQILEADDAIDEAVRLGRVMGRSQLENELVLLAEVDLLNMLAFGEIPEVQATAIFAAEQNLGHQPVLERVRRAPLTGHHGIEAEMPPGIVAELLRPTIDLPASERLEAFLVHHEDAAGRLAILVAERGDVDAAGSAMDGVRSRVAGLFRDLLGLDHLHDSGRARIGLGVQDVDA